MYQPIAADNDGHSQGSKRHSIHAVVLSQRSGKSISIRCNMIEHWVHLKCAGIRLAQYTDTWTCHQHRKSRLTTHTNITPPTLPEPGPSRPPTPPPTTHPLPPPTPPTPPQPKH